jgi:hypothetical protein
MRTIGLEWLMVFLYVGMLGLASESEFISAYQVLMSFQDMMMIGY